MFDYQKNLNNYTLYLCSNLNGVYKVEGYCLFANQEKALNSE